MFSLWLAWFCMIDLTSRRTWNNGHCIIFMKTGSPLRTLRIAAPPPQWYFWRILLLFEIRIKLEKYRQIMAEKKRASFIWQVFFLFLCLKCGTIVIFIKITIVAVRRRSRVHHPSWFSLKMMTILVDKFYLLCQMLFVNSTSSSIIHSEFIM